MTKHDTTIRLLLRMISDRTERRVTIRNGVRGVGEHDTNGGETVQHLQSIRTNNEIMKDQKK